MDNPYYTKKHWPWIIINDFDDAPKPEDIESNGYHAVVAKSKTEAGIVRKYLEFTGGAKSPDSFYPKAYGVNFKVCYVDE